jgi:nuclear transport factor 2 (NTF2) superfamily protein
MRTVTASSFTKCRTCRGLRARAATHVGQLPIALGLALTKSFIALVFVLVGVDHLRADISQVRVLPEGPVMRAEVDASSFAKTYKPQEMSQWCWAASISNIFAFYDHPVEQEKIVQQVYGRTVNLPAFSGSVIARQVNRVWTDDNGKRFRAKLTAAYDFDARIFAINNNFMINELRHGRPFLFGNTSHCMVVTAIDFSPVRVVDVGVFDPWPTSRGTRRLSAAEMMPMNQGGQMRFLATLTVTDVP